MLLEGHNELVLVEVFYNLFVSVVHMLVRVTLVPYSLDFASVVVVDMLVSSEHNIFEEAVSQYLLEGCISWAAAVDT